MKRLKLMLVMLACAGLVCSVALTAGAAETATSKPGESVKSAEPKKAKLPDFIEKMAKVLNFSEEQTKKIEGIVAESQKAMHEWETANAEKLKEARKELSALEAGKEEITKKMQTEVMAVLAPEQKAQWHEHLALTKVSAEFKKANLTDEQTKKVKEAYAALVKDVNLDDEKATTQVIRKLYKHIREEILTDKQREALKSATSAPAKPKEEPGKPAKKEAPK